MVNKTEWVRAVGLAVLLAGVQACSSGPLDADLQLEDIVGLWSWSRSEGGIAGQVITPESTGHTRALHFRADGIVEFLTDDEIESTTTYSVGLGGEDGQFSGRPVVRYGGPSPVVAEQEITVVSEDMLVLWDGCCDLFANYYDRAQ